MRNFSNVYLGFMTLVLLVLLTITDLAMSDDVYNFYFQKSPGTNTVIQNGAGQTVTPQTSVNTTTETSVVIPASSTIPSVPSATTAIAAVTPPAQEKTSFWKFSAGYGTNDDDTIARSGYVVGVGYNFNKYFGVGLTALIANNSDSEYHQTTDIDKYDLGVVVTPLSINAFGFDALQVSLLGGITSYRHYYWMPASTSTTPTTPASFDEYGSMESDVEYTTYLGLGVSLNFTKNFGVEVFSKTSSKKAIKGNDWRNDFTYSGATLSWRI